MDYPFAALVGQEQLKTALLVIAVNPSIGGVLIRGEKGTAKSTAARALAALLPPVQLVSGCPFHCDPDAPWPECPHCSAAASGFNPEARQVAEMPVPFVDLPLGATEDRVLGTLDFERALREGRRAFQPGLLAAAHRGILYIDEVNLLADHLVDVLLDAAAMGVNIVQREGIAFRHPARFLLIGTMNPEEGNLRPQLLDRFGLAVQVAGSRDPELRAEVVRRRLAFEADPAAFAARWADEQNALRERIVAAREVLPRIALDDGLLTFLTRLCCELDVDGLRADIVLHKTACTLAALDGRMSVRLEDIRTAAELVLPHRRRRRPFERPEMDRKQLDDAFSKMESQSEQSRDRQGAESLPLPDGRGSDSQVISPAAVENVRRIEVTA
ncbi:MAG TPA: ATP-binding protein, partial [Gemmataceae bacterium]|nr:ATP-binding protein [Gemmataceae bacterium]